MHLRIRRLSCIFLLLIFLTPIYAQDETLQETVIFVSPNGDDHWSGCLSKANSTRTDGPLKTLTAARDKIRNLKTGDGETGQITVYLRGGQYFLEHALELTSQDSGKAQSPIVYAAYNHETVHLIGGQEITGFEAVSDPMMLSRFKNDCRNSIVQIDLQSQGITNFGELTARGFGRSIKPAGLELFFRDQRMTLARWPNTGWVMIDQVPEGPNGGRFTYSEIEPDTWADTDDIWVHGFWTHDWADSYEHVKSIDPNTKTIETYPPHGVYGYSAKHRYYFVNVPEELDAPGEWYLDRDNGILYFWPPASIENERAIVSTTETALLLKGCSHVTVHGMTIECTRGTALRIEGGTENLIEDCTIRHIGNTAVTISGGQRNGVKGCEIYDAGDGGIWLSGGDNQTLTAAGHFAEDNHIHHYNQWCLTYRPAIGISGVGNRAVHNRIHDGPHNAIQLSGNDHLIEYNEIFNVCTQSDDVGAFYAGRSWVDRGTVIRYNFFHHIHSAADRYQNGSRVVYLDDAASGFTITGNVFYKAGSLCAINIGGGRDNHVVNNLFIDCPLGVLVDTRGVGWATDNISRGGGWHMYEKLNAVNFDQPPYSTHYPKLATILEEAPAEPRGNTLINNLAVNTRLLNMPEAYRHLLSEKENWSTETDPGFENPETYDYRLHADSPVFEHIPGFQQIPVEKIARCPETCYPQR